MLTVERLHKNRFDINNFNKEDDMTTDNQTNSTTTIEEPNYSKATSMTKRSVKATDKNSVLKTLSLRPTKSVKRNDSFKPTKKLR